MHPFGSREPLPPNARVALSLRQPWAWLVVHGGKRVENRRWSTRFRGEFLIHAAKGMTRDEYFDAVYFARDVGGDELVRRMPAFEALERGGIVGRARLVDVLPPAPSGKPRAPWHMPEQYGFVLEDVVALPFEPLRGCLGFFDAGNPSLQAGASP